MKNKKIVLSIIVFIAGILCFIYFAHYNDGVISLGLIKNSALMNFERNIFLLDAISLVLSGFIGIFTKNRISKILLHCTSLIVLIINCIIAPNNYVVYLFLTVALLSFIVHLIDNSPEKRLYIVMRKGDILLTASEKKPGYFEVLAERKNTSPSELEQQVTEKEKMTLASKNSSKKSRVKKIKGYAISPKSRYYKKKSKRKNSKR